MTASTESARQGLNRGTLARCSLTPPFIRRGKYAITFIPGMVRRDRAHHSLVRHVRVRCAWLAGKTPAAKQPAAATEARIHREVLLDAFSQLTGKQAVYERIWADLFGAGLVLVQSLTRRGRSPRDEEADDRTPRSILSLRQEPGLAAQGQSGDNLATQATMPNHNPPTSLIR